MLPASRQACIRIKERQEMVMMQIHTEVLTWE
jgi:hypothetical protein